MIAVQFDLAEIGEREAIEVVNLLTNRFPATFKKTSEEVVGGSTLTVHLAAPSKSLVPSASSAEDGTAGATAEPQPEKPKRGRPRKESPAEPENPTPAPTEAPSGAAVDAAPSPEPPSQPAAAGEVKAFTVDELRAGLQKFTVKHGMVKGKELLDSFGCARVTELADKGAEVHAQFMAKCDA